MAIVLTLVLVVFLAIVGLLTIRSYAKVSVDAARVEAEHERIKREEPDSEDAKLSLVEYRLKVADQKAKAYRESRNIPKTAALVVGGGVFSLLFLPALVTESRSSFVQLVVVPVVLGGGLGIATYFVTRLIGTVVSRVRNRQE